MGESEIDQLMRIFRMLGTPTRGHWEDAMKLELFSPVFPTWDAIDLRWVGSQTHRKHLETIMHNQNRHQELAKLETLHSILGDSGMDFLSQCLQLDPSKRPSVGMLMRHKFFAALLCKDDPHMDLFDKPILLKDPCSQQSSNFSQDSTEFSTPVRDQCEETPTREPSMDVHHQDSCSRDGDSSTDRWALSRVMEYVAKQKRLEDTPDICLTLDPNYLANQELTPLMRSILVDWLVDVAVHFDVGTETLHLAVALIDRVLSHRQVKKQKLQLLGVVCMKIADV